MAWAGQVHLVYSESPGGVNFHVQPRSGAGFLNAPLTGQSFDCETGEGGAPYLYGDQLLGFGFLSTQPASSLVRRGTAALGGNHFGQQERPGPAA